ncbi:hypothetical protein K470DRAFT_47340 [Piedraia hortae CBS 480.64]|uniref:Secreted protein n=1 Tax=Piedraia hortae CBS 480.64 TaxID=1314780 RepID=A0A6A7C2I7_9PEZI|nr:hypothetical protein K470DRAFT_47340 [Piedraia hortae CBS 480.64]
MLLICGFLMCFHSSNNIVFGVVLCFEVFMEEHWNGRDLLRDGPQHVLEICLVSVSLRVTRTCLCLSCPALLQYCFPHGHGCLTAVDFSLHW